MFHMRVDVPAYHGYSPFDKEPVLADCHFKSSRKNSDIDDYASTAAPTALPSPDLSPQWGPSTPGSGPGELDLQDLPEFELPEAEGDAMCFELTGLDDEHNLNESQQETSTDDGSGEYYSEAQDSDLSEADDLTGLDEEITDVLSALSELAESRAALDAAVKRHEAADSAPPPRGAVQMQLVFRQLMSLPGVKAMPSWMVPPASAQTGQWAHGIAPRPCECGLAPLSVCLGPGGVSLEAASGPAEEWIVAERKSSSEFRASLRRFCRGRSRSPIPEVVQELGPDMVRGRSRRRGLRSA